MDNISVRAGDPFFYAASRRDDHDQATPHGCYEGWVYLGFEGEDEDGEPALEIERVPCCRCNIAMVLKAKDETIAAKDETIAELRQRVAFLERQVEK